MKDIVKGSTAKGLLGAIVLVSSTAGCTGFWRESERILNQKDAEKRQ
jgi:hypothetical protein